MTGLELLRVIWTLGTGLGTFVMLYLLWESWKDDRAITQIRPPKTDFLRVHTRGDVWDQAVLTIAVGALFVAGLMAILGVTFVAIPLLVLSAASLVYLGILKLFRRRRIFRTLRMNRVAK